MENSITPEQLSTRPHYANFWRRLAAHLIDSSILYIAFLPFIFLFLRNSGLWDFVVLNSKLPKGAADLMSTLDPTGYLLLLQNVLKELTYLILFKGVFDLLYYSIWESSKLQGTPGKLAVGIRVSDTHGQRISFGRALGRNASKIISSFLFYIGYVIALFTERNQALHDKIAECVITHTDNVFEPSKPYVYAGFWRRLVAYILDSLLLSILLSPINLVLMPAGAKNMMETMFTNINHNQMALPDINDLIKMLAISAVTTLIIFFYYASCESSRYQATPGKLALGLKVIDIHGNKLSFWKASGRYVAKFVSALTLFIGYIMAGTTKHQQALHDELTNCLVIVGNTN